MRGATLLLAFALMAAPGHGGAAQPVPSASTEIVLKVQARWVRQVKVLSVLRANP